MTRKRLAAVVMVAVLLVLSAPASVSAANGELAVAASHSTQSDFQSAQTLSNMSVLDDTVVLKSGETNISTGEEVATTAIGDFDGDGVGEVAFQNNSNDNLQIYDPDDGTTTDTGESAKDLGAGDLDGDGTAEIAFRELSTDALKIYDAADGTTTDTGETGFVPRPGDTDDDGTAEVVYRNGSNALKIYDVVDGTATSTGESSFTLATGDTDGDNAAEIAFRGTSSDALKIYDPGDGTVTDSGESARTLTVGDADGDGEGEVAFGDRSTDVLKIYDPDDGTTTDSGESGSRFSAGDLDGDGVAEIAFRESSTDALKIYDVVDDTATSTGESALRLSTGNLDKWADDEFVFQDAGANVLEIRRLGQNADSGQYESAQLTVENSEAGNVTVTEATDVEYTVEWREGGGTLLASDTYTSTGTKALNWSTSSASQIYVNISVQSTGADPTFTLDSDEVRFDNAEPTTANLQPSDGTQLDASTVQFNVTVDDDDFALAQGDKLNATLYIDGSPVGSDTRTSQGDASVTTDLSTGGSYDYYWSVNDSYGASTRTATQTVRTPSTLTIRNETNHSDLVPADGSVRFIGEDQVYERATDDGTLNLTGLPVDESFIVDVEPTSNDYGDRTVYLDSIYEQQAIYVLNESKYSTVETRFTLDDPTGEFGPESILKIKRPVNTSSGTTFETVVADKFGVEGVTATLQNDTRYRLAITNGDTEQTIGPYRSTVSETVQVQPGQPTIDLSIPERGWQADAKISDGVLEYRYIDEGNLTSELTVFIHERGNASNELIANQSYLDLGEANGKVTLTANETELEWVVEFIIDRDGEEFTKVVPLSDRQDLNPGLGSGWSSMVGVGLLILLAGAFSMLNAAVGAVIISLMGGLLWYIGFLGGATSGAAIIIALFVSIIGYVYSTGR